VTVLEIASGIVAVVVLVAYFFAGD